MKVVSIHSSLAVLIVRGMGGSWGGGGVVVVGREMKSGLYDEVDDLMKKKILIMQA